MPAKRHDSAHSESGTQSLEDTISEAVNAVGGSGNDERVIGAAVRAYLTSEAAVERVARSRATREDALHYYEGEVAWGGNKSASAVKERFDAEAREDLSAVLEGDDASPSLSAKRRCGRIMVGHGTDTFDPTCDLEAGHDGPCESYDAIDQHHRLAKHD